MKRRHFLAAAGVGAGLGGNAHTHAADLSPTDLRPASPIGQGPPSRAITPDRSAKLQVKDPQAIKILQLTDLHYHCARDKHGETSDQRTQVETARLVARHEPDLIAFTGDVWHDPAKGKSQEIFGYALKAMTKLDTPWLFIWGNHDLQEDYGDAQAALTESPKSLYRGGHEGGNYRVSLEDKAGRPLWDLICLNTTTQGVQTAQEAWLRQQKPTGHVPALCFLHIPLLQYIDVWKSGRATGVKHEDVCTYGEDGSALSLLKRLHVQACFCGHDHVNDYAGNHDGIDLVYGRATGHAGYGGDQLAKGGKLITLDGTKGTYSQQTVFT